MGERRLEIDPWRIVETGFDAADGRACRASESLFSVGNGAMGGRANFEEFFSGESLQGNYIGGVYYPDKTRVGWWKNGYPEYFAKVLNSAFWPGVDLYIGGERLDLAAPGAVVGDFRRELDMRRGLLTREFTVVLPKSGVWVAVEARRLVSMAEPELGAVSYKLTLLSGDNLAVAATAFVEGDVRNEDANYDEKFWELSSLDRDARALTMRTRKTGFEVCWGQRVAVSGADRRLTGENLSAGERVAERFEAVLSAGQSVVVQKFVGVTSSLNHPAGELADVACGVAQRALEQGFEAVLMVHEAAWA